jgi:nitrile hydratase subunit beta
MDAGEQRIERGSMEGDVTKPARLLTGLVFALGEKPAFKVGDQVRVLVRFPIGHYRVPTYLRGKVGTVEKLIEPAAIDNEEESYGRNAGSKRHYYRVVFDMTELWPSYAGAARDALHVEIFETWLERVDQ